MKIKGSEQRITEYICHFLIMCICVGIISHIVPYFYNRSLWIDEAMLASSICTRPLSQLIASPLDWEQSAAVGWLFIVKIISMMFGTSEAVLRIWSLIASLGCIAIVYLLMKGKVAKHHALLFTAIFSLMDKYIYYGNEAKPYMSDNLFCLMALFIWQKYKEQKIDLLKVVLIYSVLIWFSFPSVFFVAACMMTECFHLFRSLIKDRNSKNIINLGMCAVVLISFVLYYTVWLSSTSDNAAGANDYYALLRFPLVPTTLSDIKLIYQMALRFFEFFSRYIVVIFIFLFLMYMAMCVRRKNDRSNLVIPSIISLLILLIASYCGFYPIEARLVQVYDIIVVIMAGYACDEIGISYTQLNTGKVKNEIVFYYGILIVCLAIVGVGGCQNLFPSHIRKPGSEVASSIEYLNNNLTEDDIIYVFRYSIPVYTYETGYDVDYKKLKALSENKSKSYEVVPILPYQVDNTIYGQTLVTLSYQMPYSYEHENNDMAIEEDADMILKNDSVYIFTSQEAGEYGIPALLEILKDYGTVETVVESYDTYLYHFVRSN